jgi:uncharacterized protein YbbK (DUF523 family)
MTKFSAATFCNFRSTRFCNSLSATHRAAVAVSACLAGEKVRYDGADKLLSMHSLLQAELSLIPICPEIGAGLGVPRPPVQLIEINGDIHAQGRDDRNLDVTRSLQRYAQHSLRQLTDQYSLCGYLWKSRSPSCGLDSTPLFDKQGIEIGRTSGFQAGYFRHHLPHINHCEETALLSERAAIIFVLRCRLVFDVLYASAAPLPVLHRRYIFLHEQFDERSRENLSTHAENDDRKTYLTALLNGGSQISEDDLLKLFI